MAGILFFLFSFFFFPMADSIKNVRKELTSQSQVSSWSFNLAQVPLFTFNKHKYLQMHRFHSKEEVQPRRESPCLPTGGPRRRWTCFCWRRHSSPLATYVAPRRLSTTSKGPRWKPQRLSDAKHQNALCISRSFPSIGAPPDHSQTVRQIKEGVLND